jgi:hypothetical protein
MVSSKKKWTVMNPIRRRMKNARHPVDRTANWCSGGCWFTLAQKAYISIQLGMKLRKTSILVMN